MRYANYAIKYQTTKFNLDCFVFRQKGIVFVLDTMLFNKVVFSQFKIL
ncbi:hypothetical protein BN938_1832 [Mucinivorans hirudinis]|uniref:Uncharacterized protein n=1 Tax=Mucinivorans hirudinis TaxID=1433126 RepID=A0A060R8T6_9BACT|nr:hypothetical protein BN938_1832 [Mucinivorans hirudinis]